VTTLQLGKRPASRDPRTLRFGSLLQSAQLHPPASYDCEQAFHDMEAEPPRLPLGTTPTPMFKNDTNPCCVIAGRAHLTLRFERRERNALVRATDQEIEWEWLNESDQVVEGLLLLDSLKAWRKWGWTAAKRQHKADLFASVDPCQLDHVKTAISYTHRGVGLIGGWELPFNVTKRLTDPEPWEVVKGPDAASDPAGGHCMVPVAYDDKGLWFVTWGRLQFATWGWFQAYCSELFAVLDAPDEYDIGDKQDGRSRIVEVVDIERGRAELRRLAA